MINKQTKKIKPKTMKKTLVMAALVAISAVAMISCKKEGETKAAGAPAQAAQKIAYVDLDSLMAHYEYFLDMSDALEKKSQSLSATLNQKATALQNDIASFQNKIQSGSITEEQATKTQASLQNRQNQLAMQQENLSVEFQKEQAECNKALHDSIDNFLQSYNKTAGYTMILARSNDNILLADPKCDITNEVIEGLNKRYKKAEVAQP